MKIITNYLPQFHCIPENDKYWGKGFTDWVSCKQAKPLFEGHLQPKVPLDNNYYSLDNPESVKWQIDLANKYDVYGFGIYHYWFHSGLNLLTKPVEIILNHPEYNINYFFIWDNNSWRKTWSALTGGASWNGKDEDHKTETMAELRYGDESEWKAHFEFLLPFFKDTRYIKQDGKPIFAIFKTYQTFDVLEKMEKYWNKLAIENGFKGIQLISRADYKQPQFEKSFVYTPFAATTIPDYISFKARSIIEKDKVKKFSYDKMWKNILKRSVQLRPNTILSGFVNFDDTPRRGNNGKVVVGATPEKFNYYLRQLLKIADDKGQDFIMLTAWNEWGEGCYLEPDEVNKYQYLEALKDALENYK